MVVVCSHNMGDIFRRNSFNLGLHVVQSPEAVEDARDGDILTFDPVSRRLTNETQGKTYEPIPLTPKEDEIRRSGGIFALGRRELKDATERAPEITWPDPATALGLTTTEQILWAHRVDKDAAVTPGATVRVYADLLPASDGTAPFAIHTFNQITGGAAIFPRQAAIANDHFVFTGKDADEKQTSIGRAFAAAMGMERPYYATRGTASSISISRSRGSSTRPAHPRRRLALTRVRGLRRGRARRRLDHARVRLVHGIRLRHGAQGAPRRLPGKLAAVGLGEGHRAQAPRAMGHEAVAGMSVELVDAGGQLPIAYRNTIANMMAEAEAFNGIFAPDEITRAWFRSKGMADLPYPPIAPGRPHGTRSTRRSISPPSSR
jgi:hypothetical protein